MSEVQSDKYSGIPDWAIVLLYSLFSEEYYASGFYSPTPRAVEQFWLWLNDHESRLLDDYERRFLEQYWQPLEERHRSLRAEGGR